MQPLGTGGSGRAVYLGGEGGVGAGCVGVDGEVSGDGVKSRGSEEAFLSRGSTGDILRRWTVSTLGVGQATFGACKVAGSSNPIRGV